MKITLKQTYTVLFLLGIFFIPFNSYEGISFLGEYRRDGAIIFFLMSFLFFTVDSFYKRKIKLPLNSIFLQILILFVGWIIIATLFNGFSIYENYMKQTSGISRFIRQFLSLSIALLLFIVTYNVVKNYSLKKIFFLIRKTFLYSFIFVTVYGVLEILVVYFNILELKHTLLLFDYFPFTKVSLDFLYRRISSFSYEPPFLAIYLITIAGWMFSYILTSKGIKKFIPTIFIFILTFFSGSRTALIVILFQFLVLIGIVFTINKKYQLIIQRFLLLISIVFVLLLVFNGKNVFREIETKMESLNFKENLLNNVSNKSRFGIQYASLLIFLENPILGVGFGQQGYHAKNKYPKWATHKNYEFSLMYLNDNVKPFPPGFNIYTRLLAEIGIIGFGIFTSFLLLIFYQCRKLIKNRNGIERVVPIVLLISFIGFAINWMQFDSFRLYGFWICLAILIKQGQEKYSNE